jgi:hypothetical protein
MVLCAMLTSTSAAAEAPSPCSPDAMKAIQDRYLWEGDGEAAEPLIRACLKQDADSILVLAQLDIALNAQKKYDEADEVAARIRAIWNRDMLADWVKRGSPVAEGSWARILVVSRDYGIAGAAYYEPQKLGAKEPRITNYFKFIVFPKDTTRNKTRLFKLEMSNLLEPYHVLREVLEDGGRQAIPYGRKKPTIQSAAQDLVKYLDSN